MKRQVDTLIIGTAFGDDVDAKEDKDINPLQFWRVQSQKRPQESTKEHTLLKLLEKQRCYLYSACLFTLLCCTGQYPNLFASLSPRIALPDQLHAVRSAPPFYSTDSGSSSISGMFPSFSTSNSLAKSSGS